MKRPSWLKRGGIAVPISSIFVSALTAALLSIILSVQSVSALSLPSVGLELPLRDTPLAPLTKALDTVTGKLPVAASIKNTPNIIGANIDTGLGGSKPLQLGVSAPIPSAVPDLTNAAGPILPAVSSTVTPVVNTVGNALPDMSPNGQNSRPPTAVTSRTPVQPNSIATARLDPKSIPITETTTPDTRKTTPLSGNSERSAALAALGPLFSGTTQALATIPSGVRNFITLMTDRDFDSLPLIISAVTFLAMLIVITGIIYMTNRDKLSTFGNARITELAQLHDLTQISVLIVVVLGTAIIACCLALAYFV